ncbi:bifunctional adenosylcobinamide kinase/adenosylcobinamide-phosphate guanylyltransferase [Brevibacillus laterosporus]|uniref:Adenosylcobinamide kinase n=1 Tax=Brevibacillus laterosporus TaxID=1465 RepID=A0AAP3DDG9_BRELA|nr:bifunctional adenosylcobinamide kinase/adenosylcobinamide-phosphate guanylyltransferase [Brevibacillus laterosporus]MCR8978477.1 bifunctional adenosylcobinamide kinase/adenosylcobinamide-phosphate guanylyltransferase [Brevibacillus laterosporus]MCZ0805632.1 bifunctional adenosylcobinamide kinase/adenosylcobinamide-phosphate guanylyltransferase [Brevibacillus laterosporus]MCZ0827989.1 bifunctional adenosylcobinamide kinase/adenosylcobinamide-phosphate guanylyltransferase [Brevibacillus lateros
MKIILITGGVRSGKSAFAEKLAEQQKQEHGGTLVYLATGQAWDEEMQNRIHLHRERRENNWETVEEPYELQMAIQAMVEADKHEGSSESPIILLDTFSGWIANLLMQLPEDQLSNSAVRQACQQQIISCVSAMRSLDRTWIVVSDEVGLGGVALSKLGRAFQDITGFANQIVAQYAEEVYVVVAGIPMKIKGSEASDK